MIQQLPETPIISDNAELIPKRIVPTQFFLGYFQKLSDGVASTGDAFQTFRVKVNYGYGTR